tara:strand:- start:485 stop:1057 length:573 start_codon:yes stop_codon:yes gene_type:complete
MKKIIYVLVFALCFSCEKECDSLNNSSNNSNNSGNNLPPQNCGTVTMDVNYLTSESFNSNQYEVTCAAGINKDNGAIVAIAIGFDFNCNTIWPGTNTPTLTPIRRIMFDYFPSIPGGLLSYDAMYCELAGTPYFSVDYNTGINDSIVFNLTNLDEVNFLISGDFSVIDVTGNTPNIDVVFSDVPIIINTK